MSDDEWDLTVNAVRMAIQRCRETEHGIRRDLAFAMVYGDEVQAATERELLAVAQEATAEYVELLPRLIGTAAREKAAAQR